MVTIEPGENPSRTLVWKPLTFLNHIKRRTNEDRFSSPQWESFLWSILGVPTPFLLGPPQQCPYNAFSYDIFGDNLQTCQTKSAASQVHDWVVVTSKEGRDAEVHVFRRIPDSHGRMRRPLQPTMGGWRHRTDHTMGSGSDRHSQSGSSRRLAVSGSSRLLHFHHTHTTHTNTNTHTHDKHTLTFSGLSLHLPVFFSKHLMFLCQSQAAQKRFRV